MKILHSQKIKCDISDDSEDNVISSLKKTLRLVSDGSFVSEKHGFSCTDINCSFGSILRNDITLFSVVKSRNENGYTIEAETTYKPSVAFWIFFVIDILLIETVIGTVVGMGATLGLYFYNKSLVEKAIIDALQKAKNEIE